MNEKTTNKSRQAALKARRYAAGFRAINEWVHDDDRQSLKDFAKCLRATRFEKMGASK